ncbi:hypothetical protein FA15DRAFT_687524 [Coprinopsis marcescibilis]|uniref:BTB domain-containing protein n=1 Tax=Coprinopsis marcescibilis TaxID=230819 RepID=A0A5C3KX05_COPMA|nr:hypothetical protein FA15DRAFT_687524 [Coprinopsis marcescibilis]
MAGAFTGSPKVVEHGAINWGTIAHPVWHPSSSTPVSIMIDSTSRLLTPESSTGERSESEELAVSAGGNDEELVVSVSSSFHPGSHDATHDAIFRTSDSVLFYVHSSVMKASSPMIFDQFLSSAASQDDIIDVPESSAVLNVILHSLYNLSCASYAPSFDLLEEAVDRMGFYNISPKTQIHPGRQLFSLLLTHAALLPLRIYAFAAHHQLHELAVRSSSYTLAFSVSQVTDAMARRMGAVYLKRLMFLHIDRQEVFKKIILQPPEMHPVTKACGFGDQKRLARAWALAAAYLVWEGKIDVPINTLQKTFSGLQEGLECNGCRATLSNRIKEVAIKWAAAKAKVLLVTDELAAPGDFVLYQAVFGLVKDIGSPGTAGSGAKVLVLSSFVDLGRWKSIGIKYGVNLSTHVTSGAVQFVDLGETASEPLPSSRELSSTPPFASPVEIVAKALETESETLVILDSLAELEWMGYKTLDVWRFVRKLRAICLKAGSTLIIRHHVASPNHPDEMFLKLLEVSSYHLDVRPMYSGRSGAVSGEIALHTGPLAGDSEGEKVKLIPRRMALQYRMTDTGPLYFEKGTSEGVL